MKAQHRKKVSEAGATGEEASESKGKKRARSRRPVVAVPTGKPGDQRQPGTGSLKGGSLKHVLIVGVGASAGGLEAFTQLLQNLPVDTGMAFVLVQHLDPYHESALTQILARSTSMLVSEVTNNLRVEANHVYVIPPNTCMSIANGVLKLRPRHEQGRMPHHSIDFFLESLAQDQRERAVGVILSGTATDGTQGLEMIKAEGGFTFAQDDSAKHDSMPRSAVAAGCVDLVLSPKQIAKGLAQIAKHPLIASRTAISTRSQSPRLASRTRGVQRPASGVDEPALLHSAQENVFKTILALLRNHRGVDFSLYKSNTIQRRIARRMVLNKLSALGDYARFLKADPKELDQLYSDLLIGVTSFFRNPEAFEALKLKVFPRLLQQQRDGPVRVWTLGCSTGQEPYSIAMAYMEFTGNISGAPRLQIFATDLSDALLDKARHAFYAKSLTTDVSPERLRRFFVEEQGGYRVCKPLRELCVFARQNVLSDPPFSHIDLISCRNMLIYIETDLQKRILPNFHYALKPGGFLFLGASESIGAFTNLFEAVDKKQKIFSKKEGASPAYHLPVSPDHPAQQKRSTVKREIARDGFRVESSAQREADRVMASRFAPPGVLINTELEVLQFRGSTSAYLEPPAGKPSFNVLKMARPGLMLPLRAALNKAKHANHPVCSKNVRLDANGSASAVNIEVIPLKTLKERCYVILFNKASKAGRAGGSLSSAQPIEARGALRTTSPAAKNEFRRVTELERELAEARAYAQSIQEQHETVNEELQASNEEVQSANEELQSTNEELETSKEELESTNEELTTVNDEMANRNAELNRLNNDLSNLHISINTAILLLGRDLTIRRFTPLAEKAFNLLPSDVGRLLTSIRHNLDFPNLEKFLTEVIDTVSVRECEVQDNEGRWYMLRARPYLTLDNKIDGAVLMLVDINAIKESEQAVIAARDYAEAIIRTARDPFLILDAHLRVERANEAFYTTFKVSRPETLGRTVFELDHGHWDIPRLRELLQDILPRHSFFNDFEVTHNFENIGHRTMLLNARMLSETSGQPARILLGIQDVSELLHFQAQMRRSELRYRRLFEAAKDGVLIIDPDTRKILDANPFMTDLLGYPHQALLGKELFEIGLLKDEAASRAAFQELQKQGFIRYEDLPLETKAGQRREVEFVSTLYQEGGGKVIQCSIRDVTERKQAEQELSEKARLLDLSNDAIIVRDLDDNISSWNQGAEKFYGWTCEEVLGKHLPSLLQTEFPKPMEEIIAQLHSEGQFRGEVIQIARDGRRVPSLCRWVLDRATQSILTTHTDITERKQMEDELRQAHAELADRAGQLEKAVTERTAELTATNKQLEAFVYSIAHDLRAPLRSMQGYSALLVEEAGTTLTERGQDFANRINNSAQFLDGLLQDLLAFSRIGQQRVELTPVNLESVVQFVLSRLENEIQEKNARVEMVGLWPNVLGHEPTLSQVLINLVTNAVKFVAPNVLPVVRLRAEEQSEFIRVWVEDNGIGIASGHQEQIFRLFTRLHGEKYPGTGIGLAIVEKGIERMGGRVGVESIPGQGSRFWFELRKA